MVWVTIDGLRGLVFLGVKDIGRTHASVLDRTLIDWYLSQRHPNDSQRQRPL